MTTRDAKHLPIFLAAVSDRDPGRGEDSAETRWAWDRMKSM